MTAPHPIANLTPLAQAMHDEDSAIIALAEIRRIMPNYDGPFRDALDKARRAVAKARA